MSENNDGAKLLQIMIQSNMETASKKLFENKIAGESEATAKLKSNIKELKSPLGRDQELIQLREAWLEALQENDLLRQRIIELEALFSAAKEEIQTMEKQYIEDLNRLSRRFTAIPKVKFTKRSKSI